MSEWLNIMLVMVVMGFNKSYKHKTLLVQASWIPSYHEQILWQYFLVFKNASTAENAINAQISEPSRKTCHISEEFTIDIF